MTTKNRVFHARATGLTLNKFSPAGDAVAGRVLLAGETFEVTPEEYELSKDRLGKSWLDLTEHEQARRWGMIRFLPGPAPEGMGIGLDDEYVLYRRGIKAKEYAQGISDPSERAAALAEVNRKYGSALRPKAQQ